MDNYVDLPEEGGSSAGVTSLNGQAGSLTLVAGTGITIAPGVSTLTISTLATTANANTVFAGPTSGAPAPPSFRALVNADVSTLTVANITATSNTTLTSLPNLVISATSIPIDNSTLFINGSNDLAVQFMIVNPPESNYFWGYASGINANASSFGNVGFGTNALTALTTGNYNIAIGDLAGEGITTGNSNIAIGGTCLEDVTTSSNNIAIGKSTLRVTTTGANNTAIGFSALNSNTTGSSNTAIGYEAGFSSSGLITSTNITLLGAGTGNSGADGITNSTAIGSGASINASNQIVLGNASVTSIISGTPSVLYNSASPMTTLGDMEYYNSGVQRLPIGTSGQVMTVSGGIPNWSTLFVMGSNVSGNIPGNAVNVTGVVAVPNGGTGNSSTTPYAVLTGGATSTSNLQQISGTGTAGQVLMSNGGGVLPSWQNVTATSGANGAQLITSGTTFTTPSTISAATQFKFTLIGGGGGGAGVAAANNNAAAGGGGGGVGIVEINGLTSSTTYNIAIGAAGTGGAAGANAGTSGGNTTVTIGTTTYTAGFGQGAQPTATTDGGAGGTCLNTTISISGSTGGSVGAAGTATVSGYGGASPGYGAQTSGRITTGAGGNGTGYGAGGAGAKCSTATVGAGGNGAQGAILVEWFN